MTLLDQHASCCPHLKDEIIVVDWSLYCADDEVIEVSIRIRREPSPNASKAPSHHDSFAERGKVSDDARKAISDVTRSRLIMLTEFKMSLDLESTFGFSSDEIIAIMVADGTREAFSKELLLDPFLPRNPEVRS